jgi:heme exporter protein B
VTALRAILLRDMRLALRIGGGALVGVLFFLVVVALIPLAVGPNLALLKRLGPAILWLGALLASLLALDRLFAADHEDGSLDLILMGSVPLELTVVAKGLAHWITTGLPLVVAVPVLGLLLDLDPLAIGTVALTLLVGTPALTFIGLIGAAIAVVLRRGGLLLPVLVLPLTVPVLIFGVSAAEAVIVGKDSIDALHERAWLTGLARHRGCRCPALSRGQGPARRRRPPPDRAPLNRRDRFRPETAAIGRFTRSTDLL